MSVLVPSALAIGAVAIVATIAIHFITRSRPHPEPLPTARFIPDRPLTARARTLALDDLALLAIRMAALVALAAAIAAPVRSAARGRVARVVAVDRSRAVASAQEVRERVRALARAGDVLVAFDSAASLATIRTFDSLDFRDSRRPPGALSTALAAAIGMGARVARQVDSVEIVLVSPLVVEELDDATLRIRAGWPGRVRVVPVSAVAASPFVAGVEVRAPDDDPLAAAIDLSGLRRPAASIRVVRGALESRDSSWAKDSGRVLVHWPASAPGAMWPRRARLDTVGAVAAGTAAMVARLPRLWALDARGARPIARWIDGEPAAVEHGVGNGCIRDVAIPLDPASDLTLRPTFRRFLENLLVPCGGAESLAALPRTIVDSIAGRGPLVAASALRDRHDTASPWSAWLLMLGALLLIVELGVRRQRSAAA